MTWSLARASTPSPVQVEKTRHGNWGHTAIRFERASRNRRPTDGHSKPHHRRWVLAEPSADLLRQLDDDPLRAADVAEPIAVFVALHLANELRAAGSHASDDGVDVVDYECDMADARGVRRRVPVAAPARPGGQLRQLEPSVAVRGLHHRDLRPDALEPHHAVHPTALHWPTALQLESELDEERRRGREVVDHDAHVVHALDRHGLDDSDTTAPATASFGCRSAGWNAPPVGLKRPAMLLGSIG